MTLTRVDGLEMHPKGGNMMETDPLFHRCKTCGAESGFRRDDTHPRMYRGECSNTSCGIATPFHYKTREDAAYAWNRKPGDPAKRE